MGLMVDPSGEVNVLEFNVRMGDPESQILFPLINEDLFPLFKAVADGKLEDFVKRRPGKLKNQVSLKKLCPCCHGFKRLSCFRKGKRMLLEKPVKMPPLKVS